MTLRAQVEALRAYMYEKGLQRQFAFLQAFVDAAPGSGVTLTGSTFGDLDLADAADVDQTPTGATGITPAGVGYPDPFVKPEQAAPTMGFRD